MPKLYTKTGDTGITSLYDGSKRSKGHIIFDVLGNLDELSSNIGFLCAKVYSREIEDRSNFSELIDKSVSNCDKLREIQVTLLDIGSNIAVIDENKKKRVPKITENNVGRIEGWIDKCEGKNEKLTEFLLPGIKEIDSQCHICRSVTRRVERSMWQLNDEVDIDENILKYMNRLSDFFFAFSRILSNGKEIKVSNIKKKLSTI